MRVLKPNRILAITELLLDPDSLLKSTKVKDGNFAGFILDAVEGNVWNYTTRFKRPKKIA
jgi:hypothetical protein